MNLHVLPLKLLVYESSLICLAAFLRQKLEDEKNPDIGLFAICHHLEVPPHIKYDQNLYRKHTILVMLLEKGYRICTPFCYRGNFPVNCKPWNGHLHYWFKKISSIRYGQSVDQRRDNSDRSSIGCGQSVDQGRVMTPRDLQLGMDNLSTKEGTIPRDLQLGYGQSVDQGRDNYYYA
jgi:hypothetical protein